MGKRNQGEANHEARIVSWCYTPMQRKCVLHSQDRESRIIDALYSSSPIPAPIAQSEWGVHPIAGKGKPVTLHGEQPGILTDYDKTLLSKISFAVSALFILGVVQAYAGRNLLILIVKKSRACVVFLSLI